MEAILRTFLRSHLSSFISSSEDEGSGLSFKGVEFKVDEYPRVEKFTARNLEILVPWAALARQSIEVHLKGVHLVVDGRKCDENRGTEGRAGPGGGEEEEGSSSWTRGRPWAEGEFDERDEWRGDGPQTSGDQSDGGSASWVGMSIRSRVIRSGLNLSLFLEDLTFTESLGSREATVRVKSLSVVNIPLEDWEGLVRNPDAWLGKAVTVEDLDVSIGQTRLHIGSIHVSSVLPLYEFLGDDYDYDREGDRVLPVSVSVSTLELQGPEAGSLFGWITGKFAGEEGENAWSVEVGVSVGQLTYRQLELTRVVILWRDGETAMRAERLEINTEMPVGGFAAEEVSLRVENGTARMDELVLTGRGASLVASAVEVDLKRGLRSRMASISCTIVVEDVIECLSSGHARRELGVSETESPPSSEGANSGGGFAIDIGMIVLGFQTGNDVLTVWSSGVQYDEGRLVASCAGIDVNCERVVGVHGAIESVSCRDQRSLKFGDVNIWLAREHLRTIDRCFGLWNRVVDPRTRGGGDGEQRQQGGGEELEERDEPKGIEEKYIPPMKRTIELGSLVIRLGETDGMWVGEVTLVDTRTGERTTVVEGDKFLESIALEDGYSLYEDRNERGVWYVARPVSFRSLLRKAVKVDGVEVGRNEETQLYVGPGGGRLCELEVEGRKVVLGVPGWGSVDGDSEVIDWNVDVLVASPGSTVTVDLGEFSCLLCSSLSSYNRLDIVLAPRVLLRNQLWCACRVEVMGEQTGAIALAEGEEAGINLDAISTSLFSVVIEMTGMQYRSLPLSFASAGSRVLTMMTRSPGPQGVDLRSEFQITVDVSHDSGFALTEIKSHQYIEKDAEGGEGFEGTASYDLTSGIDALLKTTEGTMTEDRQYDLIHNADGWQARETRSSGEYAHMKSLGDRQEHQLSEIGRHAGVSEPDACNTDPDMEGVDDGNDRVVREDDEEGRTDGRSTRPCDDRDEIVDGNRSPDLPLLSSSKIRPGLDGLGNDEDYRGHTELASNSPTVKSLFRELEDFLDEKERFTAGFVAEKLALDWSSDRLSREKSIKFATLRILDGPEKSLFSIDTGSKIVYTADHCRLAGFSSVTLSLVDDRALKRLTELRDLYGVFTASEEKTESENDPDGKQLLVSLADDVHLSCLGVALPSLSLPSLRVVITPTREATTTDVVEHVRKCAIRSLPSLILDILKAWL